MKKEPDLQRRLFLKTGTVAVGAAALGTAVFGLAAQAQAEAGQKKNGRPAGADTDAFYRGRMFFTNDLHFDTLAEAAERIFPPDENGPGALDLKVPFFIDNQLAGGYGANAREYISGPFAPGAPAQGRQSPLLRKDIFLLGLSALNEQAMKSFNKDFPRLSGTEKDAILTMCEAGDMPMDGLSSSLFFAELRKAVLGGVYADPMYGGNAGMKGWEMKNATGYRESYAGVIGSATLEKVTPVSPART